MVKRAKLVIDAWPKLIEALEDECGFLGTTPEEVAKYFLIDSLERRRQARSVRATIEALRDSAWRG